MIRTKSLLFKIITRSLLVIGAGIGIVFIPNLSLFDEALLPEITEILSKPVNANIEGNAVYSLYGFAAASDKDPHTVGKAVVEMLQSKHPKGKFAHLTEEESTSLYGDNKKWDEEWSSLYPATNCKPRERGNCFELLLAEVKEKPLTDPRLLTQLERYHRIVQLPHFIEETQLMDYTSPVPNFYLMMQTGKLSQADAYLHNGLDGLIANSQADMQFWRMALSDSRTLIGKMVAIASLRRSLSALSYALGSEPHLSQAQETNLRSLLAPLKPAEISSKNVLTGELRFSAENAKTAPQKPPEDMLLAWMLSQPTATANWHYRQSLKPAFALDQLSPMEFYERAQTSAPALEFSRFNPYNLGGKLSLSKNWQYVSYLGRAHDLAGMYLLIALQLELKINHPENLGAAVKASAFRNPYTGKPFDYDSATNSLGFQCFDVKDICRINL